MPSVTSSRLLAAPKVLAPTGHRAGFLRRQVGLALWVGVMLLLAACGSSSKTVDEEPSRQEVQALRAEVYAAMARVNMAQAEGDVEAMEIALDDAMNGLRELHKATGGIYDAEGRELYRSVVTAYEEHHGVTESLAVQHGDIFAYRDEMFDEMNQVEEPTEEPEDLPELGPVQTTIPLERNQLVEQSVQYLLRSPERHLYRWISRSATYFPMFERILREEGVPEELKYLSMIESALVPTAVSHAGAAGLWQFMPATGREYGLNRSQWIDERLDPEKSTRAAAKYLKKLHRQFDDWYLALAAYNSGPGRVSRAVRKHGQGSSFWDIYDSLPRETRNYVPMFVATATVLTNPQAFNIPRVDPGPRYAYDMVNVEGMVGLHRVAELAGTDAETIRMLNPEIRHGTTPPTRSGYRLRVPEGRGERFAVAYAALPEDERRGQSEYRVRRGDNLSAIARRHGTTVATLREVNGIRGSVIHPGQVLYVPSGSYAASSSRGGTPVSLASARAPARRSAASAPASRVTYKVRRGDNLTKIARKYDVRVADIKAWNDLSGDRIRRGQRLTVYPGQAGSATTSSGRPAQRVTYKVRRGDNLTKIARKYGVGVADIKTWNDLSGDRIRQGQRLTIYSGGAASSSGNKQWVAYYVKRGDNLTKIANRIGASTRDIRTWNSLKNDRLRVGQKLALYTAR